MTLIAPTLGITNLIRADEQGDIRMTTYLIKMGANSITPLINATDKKRKKPIDIDSQNQDTPMFEFLTHHRAKIKTIRPIIQKES